MKKEELEKRTKRELVEMAREAGLAANPRMRKAELVRLLAAPPRRAAAQTDEPQPAPAKAAARERVAIFAWDSASGLAEGEVANDVAEAAGALGRAGEDVHVFTNGPQAGSTQSYGVTYHYCATPAGGDPLGDAEEFCAEAAEACRRAAGEGGPFQVVHGYEWLTAEAVRACRQDQASRAVMTFHSTEYQRAGGRFENGASSRIRAVATSEEVRQQLQWVYQLPPEKLSVVYCGISAPPVPAAADRAAVKAAYGFRAEDPVFLYVGNLTEAMGPDLLLAGVPHILKTDRYARFVFVGDGALRGALEEQSLRAGLSGVVRFTGHMEGEALLQLLSAAEAVVFPCRTAKPLATVLFAWSAAKPVIVTHTGPAEFVWHDVTGLKVYPNEASLVWGLERILRDREFGAWMGQNGRVAVDDAFTWDAVARKLCDVYHH
jgi:glycosyltransferase involved in cell wall biosynthesis